MDNLLGKGYYIEDHVEDKELAKAAANVCRSSPTIGTADVPME